MTDYDPKGRGALCDICPLRGQTPQPPQLAPIEVRLAGNSVALVQEVSQDAPLSGPRGTEIMGASRLSGLDLSKATITSVVLCRPPGDDLPEYVKKIGQQNKKLESAWKKEAQKAEAKGQPIPPKPTLLASPIDCCKPRLEADLSMQYDIITLGKVAMTALTGGTQSIQAVRGGMVEVAPPPENPDFPPRRVMPTVSPGLVMKFPRWRHVFRSDFMKAARIFAGKGQWVDPTPICNPSADFLRSFLFDETKLYSFDLETDSIESLEAKIRCVGIGDGERHVIVALLGKDGQTKFYPAAEEADVIRVLSDFFRDPRITKTGQNANYYDRIVLRSQLGVDAKPIIDTVLLHRCAESELPHSLAYIGSMYTDVPSWKCYDAETEVLTRRGWVAFPSLLPGEAVAQWDNGIVSMVIPQAYLKEPYSGDMVCLTDQATDLCVTPNHKMIYKPKHGTELRSCEVQELPKTGQLAHTGLLGAQQEELSLSSAFIQLLVAFQADGSWMWANNKKKESPPAYLDFGFTKERKITRLKEILGTLGLSYQEKQTGKVNPRTRIWVDSDATVKLLWDMLGEKKLFGAWLLRLSAENRKVFLDELPLWDGTKGPDHTNYNTMLSGNADWVQACAVVSGRAARLQSDSVMFRVSLPSGIVRSREWSSITTLKWERRHYTGDIYCLTVPSGFLLVRRRGKVTVSGNSDRDGKKLATEAESDEELWLYCLKDVRVVEIALPKLVEKVQLRDQIGVWQRDQKMQDVCVDMHMAGMYVNQAKRKEFEIQLLKRRHKLLADIQREIGNPGFNPGSIYHLRDLLFDRWKLSAPLEPEEKYTGTGDLSTGDHVLRALLTVGGIPEEQRTIIKWIRYYRKVQKLLGTYVVKLRPSNVLIAGDLGWDEDEEFNEWGDADTQARYGEERYGIVNPITGRMYPGWSAHITKTGRLSSSKPINAQNFPSAMRGMIEAAPGHVLVGADADQIEIRVAAALWGIERYLQAFREGKDPHSMTAYLIYGDEFCREAGLDLRSFDRPGRLQGKAYDHEGKFIGKGQVKVMRSLSKAVHFASQYMAGVDRAHKMIQATETPKPDGTTELPYALLPLRDVRRMRQKWLAGAPEYERGWDREIREWRAQGYLRDPVGGRRRDFLDGENPNEIVNFKVQTSAAEIMNRAMIRLHERIPLHKWGPGTGIIGQVHDWIGIECPEQHAEEVRQILNEEMNQFVPELPQVPFTSTAAIGKSWEDV